MVTFTKDKKRHIGGEILGIWFTCKWTCDNACDRCSGCFYCENCKYLDGEYYGKDNSECCKWCDVNPYNDDRNK